MARGLGMSTPYLCAIESGRRNPPAWLVDRLVPEYKLSREEDDSSSALSNSPRTSRALLRFRQLFWREG